MSTLRVPGAAALLLTLACQTTGPPAPPSAEVSEPPLTLLGTPVVFASVQEARALLGAEDGFTRALSDFDRGLRLGTAAPVDDVTYRDHVARAAQAWTPEEVRVWSASIRSLDEAMRGLWLPLPESILLVRTDGSDEFGLNYTRQNALVIPRMPTPKIEQHRFGILAHELFHVASRQGGEPFRDEMYGLLGFEPIAARALPEGFEARRITNPDAHGFTHAIEVETPLGRRAAVPLLLSRLPLSDAIAETDLMQLLDLRLLLPEGETWAVDEGGEALALPAEDTDFQARVARNTPYVIHPEEVLADNFAILCYLRAGAEFEAADPDLIGAIEAVLSAPRGEGP